MSKSFFDFSDLKEIKIPVIGPDKEKYLLMEANAAGAAQYINAKSSSLRFVDGKAAGTSGIGHLDSLAVSICLKQAVGTDPKGEDWVPKIDGSGRPVPVDGRVHNWPHPVIQKLAEKAREISELDTPDTLESLKEQLANIQERIADLEKEEGGPAGNVQGDMGGGSE